MTELYDHVLPSQGKNCVCWPCWVERKRSNHYTPTPINPDAVTKLYGQAFFAHDPDTGELRLDWTLREIKKRERVVISKRSDRRKAMRRRFLEIAQNAGAPEGLAVIQAEFPEAKDVDLNLARVWLHRGNPRPNKKLSDEDVREIRRLGAEGVLPVLLASRFRVNRAHISRILRGVARVNAA